MENTPALPQQPERQRIYRGNPANQRDPKAQNAWKAPNRGKGPRVPKPDPRLAPANLPPPTRKHDTSHVKVTEGNPYDSSLFASNMSVRENVQRQEFSPSAPALIEIARQTYAELITDDTALSKVLLPEYLDYYATSMLWLRVITLKMKNSQPLTPTEEALLVQTQTTSFNLPEPLLLQVKQLGNVVATTKQHLYPKFPDLPTQVINGLGGYYGNLVAPAPNVDNTLHNLYEELPCLGVTSEAVCNAISNAPPGPYQSNVTFEGLQPNSNLLGFRPLGSRRNEPKNLAFDNSITDVEFPAYPVNSGFNYQFITAISNVFT